MPRKAEYDRDDLIDRARQIFWRQGWAGTSLKDLEAVLNMKPGSFYAAFGSKDALFELAMDKYAADGAKRLGDLAESLGAFAALKQHPKRIIEDPDAPAKACMLAKTVQELRGKDHPLADRARDYLLAAENRFAILFAKAQAAEDIGAEHDPIALARRYQSDLIGLRVMSDLDADAGLSVADDIAESLERL